MRALGVDYGLRRIGFAVGDSESRLVFPLQSKRVSSLQDGIDATCQMADQEKAEVIVVGMPKTLFSGEENGETVQEIKRFLKELKQISNIPVVTEDERFTSSYAETLRREAGIKKSDFDQDAAAAAAILETYLTREH